MKVLVAVLSFAALLPGLARGQGTVVYQTEGQIDGESPSYTEDFELAAGTSYVITTTNLSQGCDPVITLRRKTASEYVELVEDDDGGGNRAARIEWRCDRSGTYDVKIWAYNASSAGTCRVTVSEAGRARRVLRAEFELEGGTPRYTEDMSLEADHTYLVETSDLSAGCDPVIALRRRGSDGYTELVQDDDSAGNRAARIRWECDRSGRYDVKVWAFSEEGSGTVVLTVSDLTAGGGREVLRASIEIDGESDSYAADFELVEGRTYVIQTTGLSEDCDPVIALRRKSSDGYTDLVQDDDGAGGRAARIEWTCDRGGVYDVRAWAFNESGAGEFTLTVAER